MSRLRGRLESFNPGSTGFAEPGPDLVAVLVERGRAAADLRPLAVEAQRRAHERDALVLLGRLHPELAGERERLVDAVDRPYRHGRRAQDGDPVRRALARDRRA